MNMTWEGLIRLSLGKKRPKNYFPDTRGACYLWLSQCTVAPTEFWKWVFFGTPCILKSIIFKSSSKFKYWHSSAAPAADCQLLVYSAIFTVTSSTICILYKAQTMCKTHFDSQGMILNDFNFFFFFEKNVMANAIKNFHIFLWTSPLYLDVSMCLYSCDSMYILCILCPSVLNVQLMHIYFTSLS